MSRQLKLIANALLSSVAVACATWFGYVLSVLSSGAWKYRELLPSLYGTVTATLGSLFIVAVILKGRNHRAVAGIWATSIVACSVAATIIFFGVLANCRLCCERRIKTDLTSPNGRWRAVQFVEACRAMARFCPAVTHVSILGSGDRLPGAEGNAFRVESDYPVDLTWKSDQLLVIHYSPSVPVLRRRSAVGTVRVQYEAIPIL